MRLIRDTVYQKWLRFLSRGLASTSFSDVKPPAKIAGIGITRFSSFADISLTQRQGEPGALRPQRKDHSR